MYSLTLDLVSVNGHELNFIFAIVGLTAPLFIMAFLRLFVLPAKRD